MTEIRLNKLRSNPWRDLELYPLDEGQIDKLVNSINRHGFFGGVRARKVKGGEYELACGHHRIAAARKAGLSVVDIDVRDMSEDDMIRLMVSENAIQAGVRAAAIMNEVGAVTKRLAKTMLESHTLAEFSANVPDIAQSFQGPGSFERTCTSLESGDGLGWRIIQRYFGTGEEERSPRDKQQIVDGIASLKASGIYAKIISDVKSDILKEHGKKSLAAEKASKAAETSAAAYPRIFDETCVSLFANDDQFRAFRNAVTSDSGRRFIPIDQHFALAKSMVDDCASSAVNGFHGDRGKITAEGVKLYVSSVITEAIRGQKNIEKRERESLLLEEQFTVFRERREKLGWALRSVVKSGGELFHFIKQHQHLSEDARLASFIPQIEASRAMLTAIEEVIRGKETQNHLRITASRDRQEEEGIQAYSEGS
jgi:hypothetical protein